MNLWQKSLIVIKDEFITYEFITKIIHINHADESFVGQLVDPLAICFLKPARINKNQWIIEIDENK